jgi:hypothetical protein
MPMPGQELRDLLGNLGDGEEVAEQHAPISTVNTAAAVRVACSSEARISALPSLPRNMPR